MAQEGKGQSEHDRGQPCGERQQWRCDLLSRRGLVDDAPVADCERLSDRLATCASAGARDLDGRIGAERLLQDIAAPSLCERIERPDKDTRGKGHHDRPGRSLRITRDAGYDVEQRAGVRCEEFRACGLSIFCGADKVQAGERQWRSFVERDVCFAVAMDAYSKRTRDGLPVFRLQIGQQLRLTALQCAHGRWCLGQSPCAGEQLFRDGVCLSCCEPCARFAEIACVGAVCREDDQEQGNSRRKEYAQNDSARGKRDGAIDPRAGERIPLASSPRDFAARPYLGGKAAALGSSLYLCFATHR